MVKHPPAELTFKPQVTESKSPNNLHFQVDQKVLGKGKREDNAAILNYVRSHSVDRQLTEEEEGQKARGATYLGQDQGSGPVLLLQVLLGSGRGLDEVEEGLDFLSGSG